MSMVRLTLCLALYLHMTAIVAVIRSSENNTSLQGLKAKNLELILNVLPALQEDKTSWYGACKNQDSLEKYLFKGPACWPTCHLQTHNSRTLVELGSSGR